MNYYNSTQRSTVVVICVLLIVLAVCKPVSHTAKVVQDISKISLDRTQGGWIANFNVGHHGIKLLAKLLSCRSWIKEGLCQICDKEGQSCQGARTCFQNQKDPKISCDSSFCKKNEDYSSEERGIYGFQVQLFGQLGNNEQALIPLVFANKIKEKIKQLGQFCVFDNDWLFIHGMMVLKEKNIELLNSKLNAKQIEEMRSSAFQTTSLKIKGLDIGFQQLRGVSAFIVHSEPLAYKQISYTAAEVFALQVSLDQIGLTVPLAMLQKIQYGISQIYFPNNHCKISGGKIKCRDQIKFGGFTDSMLQLRFEQDFKISLPLHLLVRGCGSKQCKFLLQKSEKEDIVTIGSIIWQIMTVQWDVDKKMIWLHRLDNHWANPYKTFKIDLNKKGFLENMLTLIYHIFLYLFYLIAGIAGLSLLINFLLKWREVGKYVKRILRRKIHGDRKEISQNDDEQYYFGGITDEVAPNRRKINKLAQTLEDDC